MNDDPEAAYEAFLNSSARTLPNHQSQAIHQEASAAHASISRLEDTVRYLDDGLGKMAFEFNNTKQYIREWNCLIHGMKNLPIRPRSTPFHVFEFEFINHIVKVLNSYMGNNMVRPLLESDIERAHILYQGAGVTDRPVVVVRFVRRVVRNSVFFNRKCLSKSGTGVCP